MFSQSLVWIVMSEAGKKSRAVSVQASARRWQETAKQWKMPVRAFYKDSWKPPIQECGSPQKPLLLWNAQLILDCLVSKRSFGGLLTSSQSFSVYWDCELSSSRRAELAKSTSPAKYIFHNLTPKASISVWQRLERRRRKRFDQIGMWSRNVVPRGVNIKSHFRMSREICNCCNLYNFCAILFCKHGCTTVFSSAMRENSCHAFAGGHGRQLDAKFRFFTFTSPSW